MKIDFKTIPFTKVLFYNTRPWKIFWFISLFLCGGLVLINLVFMLFTGNDFLYGFSEATEVENKTIGIFEHVIAIHAILFLSGAICYVGQVFKEIFDQWEEKQNS